MVQDSFDIPSYDELMLDFEDAVSNQRSNCLPVSKLSNLKESRFQTRIQRRLTELEGKSLQAKITLFTLFTENSGDTNFQLHLTKVMFFLFLFNVGGVVWFCDIYVCI